MAIIGEKALSLRRPGRPFAAVICPTECLDPRALAVGIARVFEVSEQLRRRTKKNHVSAVPRREIMVRDVDFEVIVDAVDARGSTRVLQASGARSTL